MGNRERGAVFRQSYNDFPCLVELGKVTPSFGISRWGGNCGLRFIPPDDEGFSLRRDRRRLAYKGRRRSHRFTILGDTAFEYDCILLREPESNVISLRLEGAEYFDFFRQPDFVPDDFLKGSYAVYKKDTLIGDGTGKLCHIHRPEIIDAMGRRCWGTLSIVGNELHITISEKWLSEAKYPVIVDPTIGTTTVGSFSNPEGSYDEGNYINHEIGVNKFLASEKIQGQCKAYVYFSYVYENSHVYNPRLFDDDNNRPLIRRSCNEGEASWDLWLDDDFHVLPVENTPKWKSADFEVIDTIAQGSYIWFGGVGKPFYPRFDYGALLYKTYVEYEYADDDDEEGVEIPDFPYFGYERTYDRKFSWYFEFISRSQNYVRTLTQGVNLSDSRKLTGDYKRQVSQTVQANSITSRFQTFFRNIVETINSRDTNSYSVLFLRSVDDTISANDIFTHVFSIFRGLYDRAEIESEAKSGWVLSLKLTDTVNAVGSVFRGLILFVKIITGAFVRDYLLSRFLKARQELVLKSCVTREIILESKIE